MSPGNDAHASWSPDGQWLAFSSARGGFKDEMARGGGGGQGAPDIFVDLCGKTEPTSVVSTDDATEEGTTAFAWKSAARPAARNPLASGEEKSHLVSLEFARQ